MQDLDTVAQKDSVIDDYAMNNPLQCSAFDIKSMLFNKKDWTNSLTESFKYLNKRDLLRVSEFKSKIIKNIMEIFHFILDLRQNYLMTNLVEHFHSDVFKNYDKLGLNTGDEAQIDAIMGMVKDMKSVIITDDDYALRIPYRFPPINKMFEINVMPIYKKFSKEELGKTLWIKTLTSHSVV